MKTATVVVDAGRTATERHDVKMLEESTRPKTGPRGVASRARSAIPMVTLTPGRRSPRRPQYAELRRAASFILLSVESPPGSQSSIERDPGLDGGRTTPARSNRERDD
ncbi:unnamed protein product, partial [Ectocarpus sp. 6 AP-2014]